MAKIEVNGADLFYDEVGSGSETILFAHGLLFSCRMFDRQVDALKDMYRCITFDFRGQGRSQVTADGYDVDSLYEDTAQLIEKMEVAPCHFLGFSMGGFIAMRIAARRPELIKSLILIDTSADPEPKENFPKYRLLSSIARIVGPWAVARHVMPIMFSQKFLRDSARAKERRRWRGEFVSNDPIGITRAVTGVITRKGLIEEIEKIRVPTLIIVGQLDTSTPPEMSKRIHEHIQDSKFIIIPEAGHMTPVETPEMVNNAILEFLETFP